MVFVVVDDMVGSGNVRLSMSNMSDEEEGIGCRHCWAFGNGLCFVESSSESGAPRGAAGTKAR